MILKADIKCFLIAVYLAETIHCNIIILDLGTQEDAEPRTHDDEHKAKGNVLITNKVAWVKRIVPSNYESPKYEYDSKFKTIFAPKYRVHKRKPIASGYDDEVPSSLDQVLLQPFKPRKTENRDLIKSLDKMLKELKYDGAQKLYEKELRQSNHADRPPHEHKPFNFPHYSIWNYWTYEQDLLHDRCPDQQVKVGDMCIWLPPHRK